MLLRIYLALFVLWVIRVVFANEIVEGETDDINSTSNSIVLFTESNDTNEQTQLSQKRQERMEELERRRGKGGGSKKGNNLSDDLCRKFLYLLPILTIAPILLLLWKFPKHESYHHSYAPAHHHKGYGWTDREHQQNYYKKLDDNSFDYYRQQLTEQGLPAA